MESTQGPQSIPWLVGEQMGESGLWRWDQVLWESRAWCLGFKSMQGMAKMSASLGLREAEVQQPKGRVGGLGFIKPRVVISPLYWHPHAPSPSPDSLWDLADFDVSYRKSLRKEGSSLGNCVSYGKITCLYLAGFLLGEDKKQEWIGSTMERTLNSEASWPHIWISDKSLKLSIFLFVKWG